jgi:clan AA aspartic protease (TIGR02281 family)
VICPKCHNVFDLPANFCPHCGSSIQRGGGRLLIATAIIVLALIAGTYGYVKFQLTPRDGAARPSGMSPPQEDLTGRPAGDQRANEAGTRSPDQPPPMLRADLSLTDISGREILNAPVVILAPGWFAFPMHACIGGHTWRITLPSGRRLEVEGGILHDAGPIGLWRLPAGERLGEPALMPWTPELPLRWYPLDGAPTGLRVPVGNAENLIDFVRIPFQAGEKGPGVFMQNNRVVGWSFGASPAGGYLWTGNPGTDLTAEFYIDDFYRLTFAGGREEAFLLALADENLSDLQRLEVLAEAHRLEPRWTPAQTPDDVRPAAIQAIMHDLVVRLSRQDRAEDVLTLFDTPTVLAVNDMSLASDLVGIARDQGAYAYALELIETLQEENSGQPEPLRKLRTIQTALYRDWLSSLLAEGDRNATREVYQEATDRFSQDPGIHLVGVELALQDQDWALAERLLAAQAYPPDLRDRVSRLQQEISDLKSQEGKIVIRFRPGSRTIPVVARLERTLDQRFIIDTGASIVTVPTATARRLGIDLSYNLPRRLFYSATGVQNAVEVTLPAIELNGWVIEDVKALVVDLPGQPGVGLLGMNYLNNFRMDVNTSEGILMLEPR